MDGSAITIARAALGITQKDLADQLGITQATLSRYENNDRNIEDVTLQRIGDLLGVDFSAFKDVQRPERGPLAAEAHMRRRKSAPVGEWRKAEARLNLTRLEVGLLSRRLEVSPSLALPHLTPEEGYSPERAAQVVRAQWGMPIGPVRQLYQWIEAAGVFAFERDLSTAKVDGLSQVVDGVAVMLINSTFPPDRKRLTIAHELGHIVMHSGMYIPEDPEKEANEFAAEFLMPSTAIAPYLRKVSLNTLQALKLEWGVSMQALFERAYALGKVDKAQRVAFYKAMNRRGWKVNEPGSDRLPEETPRMMRNVEKILLEAGFDAADYPRLTGVDVYHPDSILSPPPPPRGLEIVRNR